MKFLILFVALFAVALAAIRSEDAHIVRQDSDVQPEGFKYGYETSDGSSHDEEGHLKDIGTDHEAIVVHGSVSWVAPDGQKVTLNYVADETGYHPEGSHVPVA